MPKAQLWSLNDAIPGTEYEGMSLEDIIMKSDGGIFNNAAQIWNHTFYWNGLTPNGKDAVSGELAAAIDAAFGSFDEFKASKSGELLFIITFSANCENLVCA